ncbi:MAG TPA: hypothetical protein VFJ24_10955 [Gaiellales bacterium]|nr:hypothetical protein [Gaiellales bacterium]
MTTAVALASNGAGTVTTTQHQRNVVFFSNPAHNPCNGDAGTVTAMAKTAKFHITTQADGNFWVTGSAQGTVTFTPTDPTAASGSGHFAIWFGESSNEKNDVQHDTATFQLWTTDGHHVIVKMKDHLSTNANGVVTVSFSNKSAICK